MLVSTIQRSLRRPHQAVEADGIDIFYFCRPVLQEPGICQPSTTRPSTILPPILPTTRHQSYLTINPDPYLDPVSPPLLPASEHCSTHQQQLYQNPSTPTSYLPSSKTFTESSPPSKMSTYADRLASFTAWPHASPTPEQMARAGFKHMPTSEHPDNVICKTCGNLICNWKPDHDPKIQRHIYHHRCSTLWLVLATADRKKPSASDIGFFDPSLAYDFPDLCLFQNVKTFCDRIRRLRFFETDILDQLPSCLRGDALKWFKQSKHRELAVCLGAMRARFWQQAPPEAPPRTPPEGPPEATPQACQAPVYHHCKLCNASFSSIARLMRHAQENICNKPSCRHCEKVFSSKNRLHQHLREECQKQTHRSSPASSSRSSSRPSPRSSPPCSPTWPSTCIPTSSPAPTPAPSPPPAYRAISPSPPPYLTMADLSARYAKPPCLNVDDLFRIFGGRSAATASSTITIATDDPFIRPFVFKKSLGSRQIWELGMATSRHQIAQAQCSAPRSICERCRQPPLLEHRHRQEATRPKMV